jgi:hypothetical protein
MPASTEKKAAEGNTSASSLKNKSPPEGSEEEMEGAWISPFNTILLLKTKQPSRGAGQIRNQG